MTRIRPLVLIAVCGAAALLTPVGAVAGEPPDLTPVPTQTAPVPTATTAPPTATPTLAVAPSPTPTPTSTPTPTPTVTVKPSPTPTPTQTTTRVVKPTATPTRTTTTGHRRHRRKHHHGSGHHGPKPVTTPAGPAPPTIELPTVANLQAEGRLGNGTMPAAVRRWAYLIIPAARANGIPRDIIAAVMTAESGGDPVAWNSGSNARGLMQVLNGPWDPSANIDVGASMLAEFHQEFGSWKLALAAYNAGPGAVNEYHGVPPYQETQDYVVIVQFYYREYSNQNLSASSRHRFTSSLHRFHRKRPKIRFLKLKKGQHRSPNPGRAVIPDGCDSSGPCHPRNLPHPITDPFWPLGGTRDPLPLVSPQS